MQQPKTLNFNTNIRFNLEDVNIISSLIIYQINFLQKNKSNIMFVNKINFLDCYSHINLGD